MKSRNCTLCGTSFFTKHSHKKYCSSTCAEQSNKESKRQFYEKNKEANLRAADLWAKENPDKVKEAKRKYAVKNRDKELAYRLANKDTRKQYREENKYKFYSYEAKRRTLSKVPTTEFDSLVCEEAYDLSKRRRECTNIVWHVDHILAIKLGGKHTADNLQVIPASLNLQKGYKITHRYYWSELFT